MVVVAGGTDNRTTTASSYHHNLHHHRLHHHHQILTLADEDQFLLLACDGLFDVFSPEEVVNFVRTHMLRHGDAQKCCQVSILTGW